MLKENRGTCSTKHAILAKLAKEQNFPFELHMCIFKMNANNTPIIEKILTKYNLPYIPEAHCYLYSTSDKKIIDITFQNEKTEIENIIHTETIKPEEIGEYKINTHKNIW